MPKSTFRDPKGRFSKTPEPDHQSAALSPEEIYSGVETGVAHDLGPWIETPASSRVSRFRFDHLQRQLQVQWRNGKNAGYIYENIDYDGYRAFARVASKGKYINRVLNDKVYHRMVGEEEYPSNEKRRGLGSRVRT